MRTYRRGFSVLAQRCGLLCLFAALLLPSSTLSAQQHRYRFELGAGGLHQSYHSLTQLKSAFGGVGRFGLWLPYQLSLELEGTIAGSKDKISNIGVNTRTIAGSLLYNIPIGNSAWAHLRAGAGSSKFGDPCPAGPTGPPETVCGKVLALIGGGGVRVGIGPQVLARGDLALTRNRTAGSTLTNLGVSLGLSYMLGTNPGPGSANHRALENRGE
jgi:hypothetical protein